MRRQIHHDRNALRNMAREHYRKKGRGALPNKAMQRSP
jgi:hypothetical protein